MNLRPFLDQLESAGVGVIGKTLFQTRLPSSVPAGVLLRGKMSGDPIDWEIPGLIHTGYQAIVRCPLAGIADGEALAKAVADALTFNETQLDGMYVRYSRPRHLPIVYPVSDAALTDLVELSINFEVCFDLTP